MKIVTYNLNGIRAAMNKGFTAWLNQNDFDIVCVQELKADPSQVNVAAFEELGYHAYWHPAVKKGYSGVAIFSKMKPDNVQVGSGNQEYDNEGRVLRADFGDKSVYSIYFPSGTTGEIRQAVKYRFLDFIYDYLHEMRKTRQKLIVCGDYNIANKDIDIHSPKTNQKTSGFLPDERQWMDKYFSSGFVDSFRHLNKEPGHYTWWSAFYNARKNNKGWRIDYISVTENLVNSLKDTRIMPDAMHSDHCPMMLEMGW